MINPYDESSLARTLYVALSMGPKEREVRLKVMQKQVENNTVQDWMRAIFRDVKKLRGRR